MSVQQITEETGQSKLGWDTENDRILERLAANEGSSTPWPELRKIIRQRLTIVVESLERQYQQQEQRDKDEHGNKAKTIRSQLGNKQQHNNSKKHALTDDDDDSDSPADRSTLQRQVPGNKSEEPALSVSSVENNQNDSRDSEGDEDSQSEGMESKTSSSAESSLRNGDARQGQESATSDEQPQANESETEAPGEEEATPAVDTANGALADDEKEEDPRIRDIRDLERRITYCLRTFDEAPFTIQRIAELLLTPERHYRNVMKFLRAIERVVFVTSTVEEFPTTTRHKDSEEGAAIEDGTRADAPSSLLSFLASQQVPSLSTADNATQAQMPSLIDTANARESGNDSGSSSFVAMSNSTNKPASPVLTTLAQAFTPRPPATANINNSPPSASSSAGVRSPRSSDLQREVKLPPGSPVLAGDPPPPPLDASDTGILHIQPSSLEEETALRNKIRVSVDSSVPLCIDSPAGRGSSEHSMKTFALVGTKVSGDAAEEDAGDSSI